MESENGFLPLCLCLCLVVVVPMTTRRISRPLLSPSPPPVGESAFAGVRISCRLKFQPSCALFPLPLPGVLSQTLPADLEHDVVSACATPLSLLFITLFKLSLPKLSRYVCRNFRSNVPIVRKNCRNVLFSYRDIFQRTQRYISCVLF